jgi:glycosyltransferase involved in cell wall biosynthesis
MPPTFAVIIPTYNRAALVRRALESVLSQDDGDFEIVVVDSASTDGTRDVVRETAARDARVRLICEETRRGVCPARNVAVDAATADWIIPLDSDDELAPGALALFRRKMAAFPQADHHRFMCRWDDGSLSPRPPLREEVWDYHGYLRFIDRCADGGITESVSCVRRETFRWVRYPEDRSYENLYHADFAARFLTATHPEVGRLYHTDAADQNSFAPNPGHWLRVAPDYARSLHQLLERHSAAMRQSAPRAYNELLRSAMKFDFMAGNRRGAVRLWPTILRRTPFSPSCWVILGAGLLGRHSIAYADAYRKFFRR